MPHLWKARVLRIYPARREDRAKFGIWTKVGRDKEVWALNWERGGFWNLGAGSEMVPNATNQVARYLDTIISMPWSSPSVIWAGRITYNLSSGCSKIFLALSLFCCCFLSWEKSSIQPCVKWYVTRGKYDYRCVLPGAQSEGLLRPKLDWLVDRLGKLARMKGWHIWKHCSGEKSNTSATV